MKQFGGKTADAEKLNHKHSNISPLHLLHSFLSPDQSLKPECQSRLFKKFEKIIGWDAILQQGRNRDLAPLLFHIIKKKHSDSSASAVSSKQYRALEALYYQYAMIYLVQSGEAQRIFSLLAASGIDIIPVKGIVLGTDLYPAPSLRPMGDIDQLLRERDIEQAREILEQEGYSRQVITHDNVAAALQDTHFHYSFSKKINNIPVVIELHKALTRSAFVNDNSLSFWQHAKVREKESNIYEVEPETCFCYLCWHFFQHTAGKFNFRFIWLVDLALFIRKYNGEMDWGTVRQMASRWKMRTKIKLVTFMLSRVLCLDLPVPDEFMPNAAERKVFEFVLGRYDGQGMNKIRALPLNFMEPAFLRGRTILQLRARWRMFLNSWKQF